MSSAAEPPSGTRHPAGLAEAELLAQVEESRHRASGPGGQRRNKVETAVRLRHLPTGLQVEANERRSLEQNRSMALRRLRLRLALDVRLPINVETYQPSALWAERTGGNRLAVNEHHADVPSLIAEALDVTVSYEDDASAAAECLGVTSSRLLRVLRLEPAALGGVNQRRSARGIRPYR